jgi:hypothetical protein
MKLARYGQDRGRVRSAVFGKRRLGLTYCIAWRQVSGWLRGRWRKHMDAWWHTVGMRIVLGLKALVMRVNLRFHTEAGALF